MPGPEAENTRRKSGQALPKYIYSTSSANKYYFERELRTGPGGRIRGPHSTLQEALKDKETASQIWEEVSGDVDTTIRLFGQYLAKRQLPAIRVVVPTDDRSPTSMNPHLDDPESARSEPSHDVPPHSDTGTVFGMDTLSPNSVRSIQQCDNQIIPRRSSLSGSSESWIVRWDWKEGFVEHGIHLRKVFRIFLDNLEALGFNRRKRSIDISGISCDTVGYGFDMTTNTHIQAQRLSGFIDKIDGILKAHSR